MHNNKLLWIPRSLAIFYIVFLSIFSLDVFTMEASVFEKIGGFLIHSMPSIILLIVSLSCWKRPLVCGIFFIALSLIFTIYFRFYTSLLTFAMLALPLIISGVLFVVFHYASLKKLS